MVGIRYTEAFSQQQPTNLEKNLTSIECVLILPNPDNHEGRSKASSERDIVPISLREE